MASNLYIDNIDAKATWGVGIANTNYLDIIAFPKSKKVTEVDWEENDGVEADFVNMTFEAKQIKINIYANFETFDTFKNYLRGDLVHAFQFTEIGKTLDLRFISIEDVDGVYNGKIVTATLVLSQDNPLETIDSEALSVSTLPNDYSILVNGTPISDFGIMTDQNHIIGLMNENIKDRVSVNSISVNGIEYDEDGSVRYKAKDITMRCLMMANSLVNFWKNSDAFFNALTQADDLSEPLVLTIGNDDYYFYYKSSKGIDIVINGGNVYYLFDVSLRITTPSPVVITTTTLAPTSAQPTTTPQPVTTTAQPTTTAIPTATILFDIGGIGTSSGNINNVTNRIRSRAIPLSAFQTGSVSFTYVVPEGCVLVTAWGYNGTTAYARITSFSMSDGVATFTYDGNYDNIRFAVRKQDSTANFTQEEAEASYAVIQI